MEEHKKIMIHKNGHKIPKSGSHGVSDRCKKLFVLSESLGQCQKGPRCKVLEKNRLFF